MEKSIQNRNSMFKVLITFILFLVMMGLLQYKYVFAEEGKVYYIEDLVDGTILKPGDTIYVYQDYHYDSSGSGYYRNYIDLEYRKATEDKKNNNDYGTSIRIEPNSYYTIQSYNDIFDTDNIYTSWILDLDIYGVELYPSIEESLPTREEPSKDNSYMLEDQLNNLRNNYYLLSTIKTEPVKNDGWNVSPRGEYYFNDYGKLSKDSKLTLEFEFEAEKGQFMYFDYRSFLGQYVYPTHNIYTAKLNGAKIDVTNINITNKSNYDGREYYRYNDFTYKPILIPIKTSGKQHFTLEYQVINEDNSKDIYVYNYGYIRNLFLLTYLNSGYKLDTSNLKDGDKIIYIENDRYGNLSQISDSFIYESGNVVIEPEKEYGCYTCNDELVWTNNPNNSCKINDDIKSQGMCVNNPKTGITQTVIIILIIASISILGVVLYNRKNRFSKI